MYGFVRAQCACVHNGRLLAISLFYKHFTLLLRASSLSFDSSGHLLCGWIWDVIYFSSCPPNAAAIVSICIEDAVTSGTATLQRSQNRNNHIIIVPYSTVSLCYNDSRIQFESSVYNTYSNPFGLE